MQKRLLIHSAELYSVTRDDYGAETETLVGNLQRVRIEPCEEVVSGANGEDVRCSATLFANSDIEVPDVGMVVKWGSTRYRVQRVDRLYNGAGFDHWEVRLSDG